MPAAAPPLIAHCAGDGVGTLSSPDLTVADAVPMHCVHGSSRVALPLVVHLESQGGDLPALASGTQALGAARYPKDRVQRCDPAQVLVRRVGADTLKERADLPGPLLQIRPEERQLLVVGKLGGGELLRP